MDTIKIENRAGYLYFFMGSNPLSMEDAMTVQSKVLATLRATQSTRMLFEKAGEQRKLKIQDFYAIAESFGKEIAGLKIAILVSEKLHTPEVAFFELASGSAGNNMRYFSNLAQAEAWLQQS